MLNLLRLILDPKAREQLSFANGVRNISVGLALFGFIGVVAYFFGRMGVFIPQDRRTLTVAAFLIFVLAASIAALHFRSRKHAKETKIEYLPTAILFCFIAALALVPAAIRKDAVVSKVAFDGTTQDVIVSFSSKAKSYYVQLLVVSDASQLFLSVPDLYSSRFQRPNANETQLQVGEMFGGAAVEGNWLQNWLDPSFKGARAVGNYEPSTGEILDLSISGKPVFSYDETVASEAQIGRTFTYLSQGLLAGATLMLMLFFRYRNNQPRLQV